MQQSLLPAFGLLLLLGVFGGFFIVPLNALLQERGKHSVGAGNAIAVQNLGENVAMLLMLGLYSPAVSVGVPPVAVGIGFGAVFAVAIAALWVWGGVNNLRLALRLTGRGVANICFGSPGKAYTPYPGLSYGAG